jgi:hypothetical protein
VVRGGAKPPGRQAAQGRQARLAALTVSFQSSHGPLICPSYRLSCEYEVPQMRLIVTLTAALTVLLLVLPVHS